MIDFESELERLAKLINDIAKEDPSLDQLQYLRDMLDLDAWIMIETLVEQTLP
jgi:hypothetical protein